MKLYKITKDNKTWIWSAWRLLYEINQDRQNQMLWEDYIQEDLDNNFQRACNWLPNYKITEIDSDQYLDDDDRAFIKAYGHSVSNVSDDHLTWFVVASQINNRDWENDFAEYGHMMDCLSLWSNAKDYFIKSRFIGKQTEPMKPKESQV
jgi:hypothetical protein